MSNTLIEKALKLLPKSAPKSHKILLAELGDKIPQEDRKDFDVSLFLDMVATHWELSTKSKKGQPRLKIHSPATKNAKKRKTVIDVVSNDMAFLVDSVVAEINKNSLLIDFLIHPIMYEDYESDGTLKDITSKRNNDYTRRSHIHIQIKDTVSDEMLAELEKGLYIALDDVFVANRDWPEMLAKLKDARDELANAKTGHTADEIKEYCDFLGYLHENNFTLLGYREYEFTQGKDGPGSKIVKDASLGLLHDNMRPAYINDNEEGLPRNLQKLRMTLPPVSVSKTNRLATVHRRVPMDAIAIKTYDKNGKITGEKLFIGLFTSVTYSRSVNDVPFLRKKVTDVVEKSDFLPASHDRKALRHILEKYPRDELFQIPVDELFDTALNILRLQERQRIALFVRRDPFGRYISCLVYIPRDRFGTTLRKRISKILEHELQGTCTNFYTSLDDSLFARVMFIINIKQDAQPELDTEKLEKMLQEAGETWPERLADALADGEQDELITPMTLKYGEAFPLAYTTRYLARQAIFDIRKIEDVLQHGQLELDLYRPNDVDPHQLRLKAYHPVNPLNLSDVIPILEHMGLRAISELPFEIKPAGSEHSVWIHDFLLEITEMNGSKIEIEDIKANFETAFRKIWYGEMENFGLNELVLRAGLDWTEVTILRSFVKYLKQIRYPFGRVYIEKAMTQNPKISRLLVDLFKAYHDPANGKDNEKLGTDIAAKIETALEKVESFDQDRILRTLIALIQASLRTNYFQRTPEGEMKPCLAIKFDSQAVLGLPDPKPYREIFVYSPRVEAIHLRADKIARGGLRWSDRHEDFRTEVLGLLKAQQVKNSVIVPMGAKGGFVVKTEIKDRKAAYAEGVECYKIFIRGLLDITDNLKGEKVIPPKNTVRRDGDDPYLVVAADKGTASFSDIANAISIEYGHWLGDAFASGGSAGYDHKKMGITAKGGWESVKLHFRQLNHDIQTHDFDVTGVGDMGGDVFGNAMLLSKHIRLVGAFNHVHIFCDPDPDPASSFKERQRLFKGVLGWDQYDTTKLSKGGRIFSRDEKVLTLTPEIKERFDITQDKISPIDLMRAILKARTDLCWFGGIGTYVKATLENHMDVGDKANDAIRIDATELRAKVIGEGANMAITQRARIEYFEKGGRINTDFIDNSAGVNSSDVEVNIKILLTDVMSQPAHKMTLESRNKLLEGMTEDVAAHVLRNNYQQAQAISLAEHQARENLQLHSAYIKDLERNKMLTRKGENLPDQETIDARLHAGKGLTRPELCTLVSYSKIEFTKELLHTDLPDNQDMKAWLMSYFPRELKEKYTKEIERHKLRREIIAMSIANSMINRMGPGYVKFCMEKTGAGWADIARAYVVAVESFGLRKLWPMIEELDNKVPAEVQLKAMREIAKLSAHAMNWFLTRHQPSAKVQTDIDNFTAGIEELRSNLSTLLPGELQGTLTLRTEAWTRDGMPKELASEIAKIPFLYAACDIIRTALEEKANLQTTARTYFELGERFHMDWLRQQARFLKSENAWQTEATDGIVDQLYGCQVGLTLKILKDTKGKSKDGITQWLEDQGHKATQLDLFFIELRRAGTMDLPMLVIADQRLRNLYGG